MFKTTSNAHTLTGDRLGIVFRKGLPLEDMEFHQFHPTGRAGLGILIAEVRALSSSRRVCAQIAKIGKTAISPQSRPGSTLAGKGIAASPASKQHHYAGRDTYTDTGKRS
jgi:aspartate oxidase